MISTSSIEIGVGQRSSAVSSIASSGSRSSVAFASSSVGDTISIHSSTNASTSSEQTYEVCAVQSNYDNTGVNCYVDSEAGNDDSDGKTAFTPVRTQLAIPDDCDVVRFKRGSVFYEKLKTYNPLNGSPWNEHRVKVYTNYGSPDAPLPHFVVSSSAGSGPVIQTWSELTIDGLHLSGARGDNTMVHDFTEDENGKIDGIVGGVGAFLGDKTLFVNNEVDGCDIGIMVAGQYSVIRGNYVHDLVMGIDDEPGVDPNLVGGAEGIFVNAANVEVSYNAFVNCTGPAKWVGENGSCDGGATEISAKASDDEDDDIFNVHIHHNYSRNNCGFLEVASFFDASGEKRKGKVRDSSFHHNMIIDSAWMGLLQVNNTDLENIQFYNNTLVQHAGSLNEGLLWIIFTDTSSGFTGGELVADTVFLKNNLFVLDGVYPAPELIHENFNTSNNIVRVYSSQNVSNYNDLGFANITGVTAADFELVDPQSDAVDTGLLISDSPLDYFNRSRTVGRSTDIGALEHGASQEQCLPGTTLY